MAGLKPSFSVDFSVNEGYFVSNKVVVLVGSKVAKAAKEQQKACNNLYQTLEDTKREIRKACDVQRAEFVCSVFESCIGELAQILKVMAENSEQQEYEKCHLLLWLFRIHYSYIRLRRKVAQRRISFVATLHRNIFHSAGYFQSCAVAICYARQESVF